MYIKWCFDFSTLYIVISFYSPPHAPGGGRTTTQKSPAGAFVIPEFMPPVRRRTFIVKAYVAVAHSMLVAIYHILKDGTVFQDLGADYYNQFNKERKINAYLKKLKALGWEMPVAIGAKLT